MRNLLWPLVIITLLGGAFLHYAYYHGLLQGVDHVSVRIQSVKESTDEYDINVVYPVFGVRDFDAQIKQVIDAQITQIKNLPKNPSPTGYKNTLETSFTEPYVDEHFVSVKLDLSEYTGGAHGITITTGFNWDRTRKKVMKFDDALALTGLDIKALSAASKMALESDLGPLQSPEGVAPNPENFGSFVINAQYVTFIFQPYQVAAYAAGEQEVSIQRVK